MALHPLSVEAAVVIPRVLPLVPPALGERQELLEVALLCIGSLIRVLRVSPPDSRKLLCYAVSYVTCRCECFVGYCRADDVPSFAVL